MQTYLITYLNEAGEVLGKLETRQWSRWDACSFGWTNAPRGTDDFMLTGEGGVTAD